MTQVVNLPAAPTKTDLAMAALAFSGLLPVLIAGIVIIVFIGMFSFLVFAHKRKAAEARVRSIQKSEEMKKERKKKKEENTASEVVIESPESIKDAIHKEEVLFVKRVFPHIISLSEEDLGLNL